MIIDNIEAIGCPIVKGATMAFISFCIRSILFT